MIAVDLWLDDVRPAPAGWVHCERIDEAQKWLLCGEVDRLSLDHDLGEGVPTGYELVVWMASHGVWPKSKPVVHSANPMGAARMRGMIDQYWPRGWNG